MASDFQQKIKTMTGIQAVVQSSFMELGGIITAITQIWMENTLVDLILHMLMVLIGISGKDITTP